MVISHIMILYQDVRNYYQDLIIFLPRVQFYIIIIYIRIMYNAIKLINYYLHTIL